MGINKKGQAVWRGWFGERPKKAGKSSETGSDLGKEVKPGVGRNKGYSSVIDANKRCCLVVSGCLVDMFIRS